MDRTSSQQSKPEDHRPAPESSSTTARNAAGHDHLVPDASETQVVRSFSEQEMRQELARILTSRTFRAAQGQRKFLGYTVEKVIAKDVDLIKEYVIGTEAFGRAPSFDPRLDSIVRTEARKLRARLVKYYETEGGDQRLRIGFRKGSYVPFFYEVVVCATGVRTPASLRCVS
jgi:hypothetical protein